MRLAASSAKRPAHALILSALATALFGVSAAGLTFDADYGALLPADAPETLDYRWADAHGAGAWYTVVSVDQWTAPERSSSVAEAWTKGLAEEIGEMDEVSLVVAGLPSEFFRAHALYFADDAQIESLLAHTEVRIADARRRANPLFIDLEDDSDASSTQLQEEIDVALASLEERSQLLSNDGRHRFVLVRPRFSPMDLPRSARFLSALEDDVASYAEQTHAAGDVAPFEVRFAGPYASLVAEDREIDRDLRATTTWAVALVLVVLLAFTRSVVSLVVIALPLVLAIAATLCWAHVWVGHLNLVSGFLTPVLFGMGVDFGIHFHDAYAQARRAGRAPEAAAIRAAEETAGGSLLAAVTTSAAFASLAFARFRGFSEFGGLGAVGVLAALAATFAIAPALLVRLDRLMPLRGSRRPTDRALPRVTAWAGLLVIALLFAGSVVALPGLAFEGDLDRLRADSESLEFESYVQEAIGGAAAPALVYLEDADAEASARNAIEEVGESIGLVAIHSLADFVPEGQEHRATQLAVLRDRLLQLDGVRDPEARRIIDLGLSLASARPFGEEDLPSSLRDRFRPGEPVGIAAGASGTWLILEARYDESSIPAAQAWALAMNHVRAAVPSAHILSGAAVSGRLFSVIFEDGPRVVAGVLLALFIVLFYALGTDFVAPFLLTVMSLVALGGLMAALSIRLNIFNALMLPTLLGVGVDNAVHVVRSHQRTRSLWVVLATTGRSALAASLTTGVGFGTLALAHHRGVASIGSVAALGTALAYLFSVLGLLCVLRVREDETS